VFAPLGVAPFLTVVAVVALVLDGRRCWQAIRAMKAFACVLAMVGFWAMASSVWSILPEHSLFEGARFLTIGASGLVTVAAMRVMTVSDRQRLIRMLAVSTVATIAVFLIDLSLGDPLVRFAAGIKPDAEVLMTRFDRGTTVLGLLFWPTALGLRSSGRYRLLLLLIAAMLAAFVFIPSSTNRLAAAIGAFVLVLAWWNPRVVAAAAIGGMIVLAAAMPIVMPRAFPTNETVVALHHEAPWIKFSALHRFLIWRFVSERIADRPLLGWGMDASRELPGGHEKIGAELSEPVIPPSSEALPLHPHNAFLQWEVELGAPGAILCLAIAAFVVWRAAVAGVRNRLAGAAALACAAAGLTIALLGYGIWQAWWMSCLWCAAALFSPPAAGTASDS
jgi:hypothetical protein